MRARCLVTLCLLFCISACLAQDSVSHVEPKKGFWDRGFGRMLKRVDNKLKEWEASGIDTNYVRVPERDRYVYLGSFGYFQQHNMDFPVLLSKSDYPALFRDYLPSNFAEKSYISTRIHSFQTEMELGLDWRGVTIELPITISNHYNRSFGLAKNGSVWGMRLRFKHLKNMNGKLDDAYEQMFFSMVDRWLEDALVDIGNMPGNDDPIDTHTRSIKKNELELKTFYTEAYYVFNHKKFSLSAGMYGDMVQLRPAGSVFVMGNYYQSILKCNDLFNFNHDTFRSNKVSLGVGYGYNLPFLNGRLCLHLSTIPMLSFLNRVTHRGWDDEQLSSDEYDQELIEMVQSYEQHYYDAYQYGRDSAFRINAFSRFAINYSFKRWLLSFVTNYRMYLFGSSSGLKMADRELDMQLNFGWRF